MLNSILLRLRTISGPDERYLFALRDVVRMHITCSPDSTNVVSLLTATKAIFALTYAP